MLKNLSQFLILSILATVISAQQNQGCNICKSREDPRCLNVEEANFRQPCLEGNVDFGCYSRVVDGAHVDRGCVRDLPESERASCNTNTCRICWGINESRNGSFCNSGRFPEQQIMCVSCNATRECFGDNGTVDLKPQNCLSERCFTRLINNSTYERGCLTANTVCERPSCETCMGDGCNNKHINGSNSIQINLFTLLIALISVCMVRN